MSDRKNAGKRTKACAVMLAVGLLVTSPALTASAAAVENGTAGCNGKSSAVQGKTKGHTRAVLAPGKPTSATVYTYGLSTTQWATTTRAGNVGGGYWEVYSSADLDTVYTKGYCTPGV